MARTAKQAAALRKAQLASAKKRRGRNSKVGKAKRGAGKAGKAAGAFAAAVVVNRLRSRATRSLETATDKAVDSAAHKLKRKPKPVAKKPKKAKAKSKKRR